MKACYTILFFIDAFLLVLLFSELFKIIDLGADTWKYFLVGASILASLALLPFLLIQYLKETQSRNTE